MKAVAHRPVARSSINILAANELYTWTSGTILRRNLQRWLSIEDKITSYMSLCCYKQTTHFLRDLRVSRRSPKYTVSSHSYRSPICMCLQPYIVISDLPDKPPSRSAWEILLQVDLVRLNTFSVKVKTLEVKVSKTISFDKN